MNPAMDTQRLELDLTQQEPIPPAGVQAALALMASGKLHRYGEAGGKPSEVSALEVEFARTQGRIQRRQDAAAVAHARPHLRHEGAAGDLPTPRRASD